jgi:hypothetical protein
MSNTVADNDPQVLFCFDGQELNDRARYQIEHFDKRQINYSTFKQSVETLLVLRVHHFVLKGCRKINSLGALMTGSFGCVVTPFSAAAASKKACTLRMDLNFCPVGDSQTLSA